MIDFEKKFELGAVEKYGSVDAFRKKRLKELRKI